MYNIKTLNKISPVGLDKFASENYNCGDDVQFPDAIMVRSASMHEYEFEKSLKCIARAGAGVNNIPLDKCAEQGIVVFNTPGANANAVKELVILSMLLSSRKITSAMEWVKTLKGNGDQVGKLCEKGKSQFVGPEIKGKRLGVVGLGAIGVMVCNAAVDLGMKVYGYDPYVSIDNAWNLSQSVQHAKTLKEIYENCDYITLHVPATPETKGMINSESIAMMKSNVRIINLARGELVVENDIVEALEQNRMSVYVADFCTDNLIGRPGVILFPHLGASTPESEDNCAKMAAKELIDYLENGNIVNSVNMPCASMPRSGDTRICIIHRNEKSMLSQISGIISDCGLNIENMMNKSRGGYAYTILDVDGNGNVAEPKLRELEGTINVRTIK